MQHSSEAVHVPAPAEQAQSNAGIPPPACNPKTAAIAKDRSPTRGPCRVSRKLSHSSQNTLGAHL